MKYTTKQLKQIKSWQTSPSNFSGHWPDDQWAIVGAFGAYTDNSCNSETDNLMIKSNQSHVIETLGPKWAKEVYQRHWAAGGITLIEVMFFTNEGKPTKAGLKAFELIERLEEYPLLDESGFSELEHELKEETFKLYCDDFTLEVLKYFELDSDICDDFEPSSELTRMAESIAYSVYSHDCGYCGTDDAWVNQETIERFLNDSESDYCKTEINTLRNAERVVQS